MKNTRLLKISVTAMLAALICVSTIVIQVPSPLGGYINLGDGFIIVSAVILPPFLAFGAGSIGSALADIFTGYAIYAPATFIIKGCMALTSALLYRVLSQKGKNLSKFAVSISAIPSEIIMVIGYYLYAAVISGGFVPALQTIPPNTVQGAAGILCGTVITLALKKTGIMGNLKGLTL